MILNFTTSWRIIKKMSYKVGDKVKLRDDLFEGKYGSFGYSDGMKKFVGLTCTIDKVINDYIYELEEDDFPKYVWVAEMLEPVEVDVLSELAAKNADNVNHPQHYQGKRECIEEMILLFGIETVKGFCKCNVHKYRYRATEKGGQEDLDKANWYMDYLEELEQREV